MTEVRISEVTYGQGEGRTEGANNDSSSVYKASFVAGRESFLG